MGRGFNPLKARQAQRAAPCEIVLLRSGLEEELRAEVAGECTIIMGRLEQARIGWHQFERQDKPAFIRWRAREFGALLSTARDVEDRIREAQNLIHAVEMEMRRLFQDPYTAYQRVMFQRQQRQPDVASSYQNPNDANGTGGQNDGVSRKLTEFEKEALFQEWVKKFLGTDPDKMDDKVYSAKLEGFKSHMFGASRIGADGLAGNAGATGNSIPAGKPRKSTKPDKEHTAEEPAEIDPRVKELYRRLVRRLHPDLRADGSAAVSALWHEVQEAYAASDIARMELLLALSDLSGRFGVGTTLSQMRSVLAELNRSVRALEQSLVEAQREDAWNFVRIGPSDNLRSSVERQLKHDLASRQDRLNMLDRTIAEWARGPVAGAVRISVSR